MTTDDLLFSNNSNVFVVDDETARISEERKRFHLRCHFRRPFLNGEAMEERLTVRFEIPHKKKKAKKKDKKG